MTTEKKEKKEFFLSRWIKNLCLWADEKLFPAVAEAARPTYMPMWWSFCVSFAGGLLLGLQSLFSSNDGGTFATVVMVIALVAVAAICVMYLLADLKRFETVGMKVARSAYMVFLVGLAFFVGFYLAMIVLLVVLCIFVLWICIGALFGFDDDKKKKKTIVLDNGQKLTEERNLDGSKCYVDSTGNEWEEDGDTFTKKQY